MSVERIFESDQKHHNYTSKEAHRRFLKEANGSILIVHKALSLVAQENNSRKISIEDVIQKIKYLLGISARKKYRK